MTTGSRIWIPTGGRQSGRTWRQLQQLPDGAVFVVSHLRHVRYCKDLLAAMGRQPDAIRFMTPDSFRKQVERGGFRSDYDIDHATDISRELADLLVHYATRRTQPFPPKP